MLRSRFSLTLISMALATASAMAGAAPASTSISVRDDAQRIVTLDKPAQRIISLAPHITELLFASGASKSLVAVSDYSDYPEAAKKLPSVGNVFALDLERILALKPDLVIIWGTGNAKNLANQLRSHQITVFESEPKNYEMIATSLERFAILAGSEASGRQAAGQFRERLETLRKTYALPASAAPVTVFYQVWNKPLMTLNDEHMVSAAIRLCGGKNIFGSLKEISPTVSTEAVLAMNPDAFITGGNNTDSLNMWRQYPVLKALKPDHLYAIKADWLNRSGPRILDGTEALCKAIRSARQ